MVGGIRRHTFENGFSARPFHSSTNENELCLNKAKEYFGQLHQLIGTYPTHYVKFEIDEDNAISNFRNQILCGARNSEMHCPSNTEDSVAVYNPNYQHCKLLAILLSRVDEELLTLLLPRSMFQKQINPIITNYVLRTIASRTITSKSVFKYTIAILKENPVELTRVAETLVFIAHHDNYARTDIFNRIKYIFALKNYNVEFERKIAYNLNYDCAAKGENGDYLRAFIYSMGQCEYWVFDNHLNVDYQISMWKKAIIYDYNKGQNTCHTSRIAIYSELNEKGAFTKRLLESGDSKTGLIALYAAISVSKDFRYSLQFDIFYFSRTDLTPILLDTYHRLIHSINIRFMTSNAKILLRILDDSKPYKNLIDPTESHYDITSYDNEMNNRKNLERNPIILAIYERAIEFILNDSGTFDNNGLSAQLMNILENKSNAKIALVRVNALKVLLEFRNLELAERALKSLENDKNKEIIGELSRKLNDVCFCGNSNGRVTMTPCCGNIIHPTCIAACIENPLVSGEKSNCPYCRSKDFEKLVGR